MRFTSLYGGSADIECYLNLTGVDCGLSRTPTARGPHVWEGCDALAAEGPQIGQDCNLAAHAEPDDKVGQRING